MVPRWSSCSPVCVIVRTASEGKLGELSGDQILQQLHAEGRVGLIQEDFCLAMYNVQPPYDA